MMNKFSIYRQLENDTQWRSIAYSIIGNQRAVDLILVFCREGIKSWWEIRIGKKVHKSFFFDGAELVESET